jgi:hypothetical protein
MLCEKENHVFLMHIAVNGCFDGGFDGGLDGNFVAISTFYELELGGRYVRSLVG